ncbi:hypothetical protein [Streptomyces sp. ET3-23]|uniref:hypothetical protein n=1 Tax=Streptomyces sp. ET3-23 TaxID=2885643 RepID=UPI0022350CB7|nr:hypothetical protein [Streptomyces sp. ET3-23]
MPASMRCSGALSSSHAASGVRPSSIRCGRSVLYQRTQAASRSTSASIGMGPAFVCSAARFAAGLSPTGRYKRPEASRGPPVKPGSDESRVCSIVRFTRSTLPLR